MSTAATALERLGLLRHRNFAWFWMAGVTSNTGTWAHVVASTILVFALTQSTAALGVLGFATYLPLLLFTLPAGVIADRFDRRRVVVLTHMLAVAAAATLATLVLLEKASLEAYAVSGFAVYTAYAISKPALSAIFPSLVPRDEIAKATALNSLTYVLGQFFGPLIASIAVALQVPAAAFALNAGSYLVVMVVVTRLPLRSQEAPERRLSSLGDQLLDGLRFALRNRDVRVMLIVLAVAAPLPEVMRLMAPAISVRIVANQEGEFAGLIAAAVGLGSATGLFAAARYLKPELIRAAIHTGLVVLAVASLLLATAPNALVAIAAALAVGGGFSIAFASVTGAIQAAVPDALRGRVLSIHTLVHLGTRPLFTPIVGLLGVLVGIGWATVAFVAILPLGNLAVLLRSRERGKHVPGCRKRSRRGPDYGE